MNILTRIMLMMMLMFGQAWALNQADLLDVDEAFAPEILNVGENDFTLRFSVADEYYLYRHAFKFPNKDSAVTFGQAKIPAGKKKKDEFFGEVETYHHQVDVVIPYENPEGLSSIPFTFRYQGCAEAGVCYPPQKKTVNIDLSAYNASASATDLSVGGIERVGLGLESDNQWAGQTDSVLPVEQAFTVETIAMDEDTLSTRFTMSPNVYLYKDKVKLTSLTDGIEIKQLNFPAAKQKDDPHFGKVEVFFDQIEVDVEISRTVGSPQQLQLQAEYQGCVDEGICYPPAKKTITVDLPKPSQAGSVAAAAVSLSEQDQIQQDIEQNSWWLTILKFLGFGLLLALTPCIFPMIPILSGLIIGQGDITRSRAFMLSLVYVLAMALAYTAAGVIAGLLGANIQAALQKPWIIITFSLVFVGLAMSMFGYYDLQLPASWQNKLSNISNKQKSGSYIGVGIMGFLSAIIVGPCVAPPLAGAVLYISNTGDPIVGGFALFAMSIGMGVPLLIIGASAGKWMPQSGGWMNVVKAFFGVALLAMAVWFLSRIIPGRVTLALFGILALLTSIFWYRYALKNGVKGKMVVVFFVIKLALMGIGIVQIYGAIKGHTDFMHPLTKHNEAHFTEIKSYQDLQAAMKATDKPVLLDFYADWCVECIRMEGATYSQPEVQKELERFLVLKADVTAQDDIDVELMKQFKIIGPPATLFFDKNDQLINQYSFFGFKGPEDFIIHLQKIK